MLVYAHYYACLCLLLCFYAYYYAFMLLCSGCVRVSLCFFLCEHNRDKPNYFGFACCVGHVWACVGMCWADLGTQKGHVYSEIPNPSTELDGAVTRRAPPASPARPENGPFSRRTADSPGERRILPETPVAQRSLAALATTISPHTAAQRCAGLAGHAGYAGHSGHEA